MNLKSVFVSVYLLLSIQLKGNNKPMLLKKSIVLLLMAFHTVTGYAQSEDLGNKSIVTSAEEEQSQKPQEKKDISILKLTSNGSWCWFSGPRAIYLDNDRNELITGWITSNGCLEAGLLNYNTGKVQFQRVESKLDKDDHANPGFAELSNHDILMAYSKHFDHKVRINKTPAPLETLQFGRTIEHNIYDAEELERYPNKRVTYANPFRLEKENNRIYCFGRWTGYKPNITWSDDNGQTFVKSKVFITNIPFDSNNRPYVCYYTDGQSKIHILFTDGHPRNEPLNSVYYACYEKGAFWQADGTKICDMNNIPFEPEDATLVYKATKENGRAWIYDLSVDKEGHPVILYARYPEETAHFYHYAVFDGCHWIDNRMCHAGKWFPQTPKGQVEPEPHYSAGMSLHPLQPGIVYLSRDVEGTFEIEKWVTSDRGKNWENKAITQNSKYDNVRPLVPKNMKTDDPAVVLWMVAKKYRHYTDYKTRINYLIDEEN
ncbi:BNR-4 repeat-containing protein [Carboxylicivirga mesophila]|uniref:BNR-4 repeat-containing protein n=1 Tax=Carboxylicivirga mesophila TaxID=1166478 RepID=A0ABS5KB01_9BACT|nr:BNR-4 repeat-containing protein [Carboxylicivirga mesophila]MBS2212204.1 BNR-4 repeat-containing protein [Carboxylicivirga mesophila]